MLLNDPKNYFEIIQPGSYFHSLAVLSFTLLLIAFTECVA